VSDEQAEKYPRADPHQALVNVSIESWRFARLFGRELRHLIFECDVSCALTANGGQVPRPALGSSHPELAVGDADHSSQVEGDDLRSLYRKGGRKEVPWHAPSKV
jgi:hypothetical protein